MTNFRRDLSDGGIRDNHSDAVIEEAPILSLTLSSSGPMVLLDSGAAVSVVMSCLTPYYTSVYPSLTCVLLLLLMGIASLCLARES